MKKIVTILGAATLLAACGVSNNEDQVSYKPGEVVAADSMAVQDDELNNRQYMIKLTATDSPNVYNMNVAFGYNAAQRNITLPDLDGNLKPAVKRDTGEYAYVVGFTYNDDTSFHDYMRVWADSGLIQMRYLKAYSQ